MSNQTIPTFIPEDIAPTTAFTQSGKSLRISYVLREESKYIANILLDRQANPLDPTIDIENYDEKTWEIFRNIWRAEAEIKYPDEGDYVVQIVDPDTGLPVPLGEMVTFVGGDIREVSGGQPCIEYTWDLSLVPGTFNATLTYTDCFNVLQTSTKTVADWGPSYQICAGNPDIIVTIGTITPGIQCGLTYKQCTQYFWDLTGVPPLDIVTIDYVDCDQVVVSLTSTATAAVRAICGERDSFTVTAGVIVLLETCI